MNFLLLSNCIAKRTFNPGNSNYCPSLQIAVNVKQLLLLLISDAHFF